MSRRRRLGWSKDSSRGVSLYLVAGGMVFIMGVAGFGIDLSSLYVGRAQAQRAADAAALAGAQAIVDSGYPTGLASAATAQAQAMQRAIDVGNQNLVAGVNPNISASDIAFDFSNASDPRITVAAARDAAHGNPMPTFFVKIFGINSASVSAAATAEAFTPSGTGIPVGAKCLKPWLLPNCDPGHELATTSYPANPNCQDPNTGEYGSYFIDPTTGTVINPGPSSAGGVVGEFITDLKPGSPSSAAAPGKFEPVFLPPGSVAATCPSCANGGAGGGTGSGALYRQNIECCNQNTIVCGQQSVQPISGDMTGPTKQGVDCLIHQPGQDTMASTLTQAVAGSSNPYLPSGSYFPVGNSDSTVTVPIYDGSQLCPGSSCPSSVTVQILGFMQMFVNDETNPQGTVQATVLGVAGCGTGGSGSGNGGNPISVGASPIPVRLVQ